MKNLRTSNLIKGMAVVLIMLAFIYFITDSISATTITDGRFHVTINGEVVKFNDVYGYPKLIKETERTLVPLRIISESMGYDVDWNQATKTAIIKGGGSAIEIKIGENTAVVNGNRVPIDVDEDGMPVDTKAMLLGVKGDTNPRTYVPLRFISETTGAKIGYERVSGVHHITITTKGAVITPPVEDGKIKFDPAKDIMADGRITEAKSIEYLEEVIKRTKIIKENGKYYFKYDHIDLPSYGDIVVGITLNTSSNIAWSTSPVLESNRLPKNQSFKKEIPANKIENIDRISISLSVLNMEHTNKLNPTSARLMYDYYKPSNTSDYDIVNQFNGVIRTEKLNKSIILNY